MKRFASRAAAGAELGRAVAASGAVDGSAVVIAIPHGGIPVAAAVAQELGAPVDIAPIHEVTAHREDLGLGTVTTRPTPNVHRSTAAAMGVEADELASKVHREQERLGTLIDEVRAQTPPLAVDGVTVVIVDDALAVTAPVSDTAAAVRGAGAHVIILAVPLAAGALVDAIAPE